LNRGILVKPFKYPRGGRSYIRVTVGTREENEAFIEALRGVVAK
jgi:histidinol-phosphate/aromatic aminotransferase/cobyric acid decarboxylase-like protein